MKLAVLVHGGVDRSGEQRVIPALVWLLERLARTHDVHVFAREQEHEPDEWDLAGVRVHNIGMTPGRRRRLFQTFQREHLRAPFTAIQGVFGWGGSWGAVLGWRHRLPMTFHAAGGEFVGFPDIAYGTQCSARGRFTLAVAARGARTVTVATERMRELAAVHGVTAEIAPLGVALDRWPPVAPRVRNSARPARLLHVGDLRPVKDQMTLLLAAESLSRQGIDFELDICGVDTMDGALQKSPAAQAVADRTRWHGSVDRATLRSLMLASDILLVSSRHEAGPLVVLEAAIAGVPTVGTAVGHVSDWRIGAAVAVPVGDWGALARETAALVLDEPRRLAIAHEAQRRALAMDADFTAARFSSVYASMTQ